MYRQLLLVAVAAAALGACNNARNDAASAGNAAGDATASAGNAMGDATASAGNAMGDATASAGNAASDAADSASNAMGTDNAHGPVVAAPHGPGNPAIDTTPTTGDHGQASGASSFTEGQARGALEHAGYTNITGLTQNSSGQWEGAATRHGHETHVSIDYRGAITAH
jgi:hypothetical protein